MNSFRKKNILIPVVILLFFEASAFSLWIAKSNIFYLFNFTYLGLSISTSLFLFLTGYKHARRISQLLVGMYMLAYLGIICKENMQIEGFWYCLLTLEFSGAAIHYVVAKILGPLLFGRGFCGYACWTTAILDFLPYKTPAQHYRFKIGWLRYFLFALSFALVFYLFVFSHEAIERKMVCLFIVGNILYYIAGALMAVIFNDNRAFCKYACPVSIIMKPFSFLSLIRIRCDKSKCTDCGICKKVCPMNVDMTDDSRHRKNGTDCILCAECMKKCPNGALKVLK